jgi:hypothetical protein
MSRSARLTILATILLTAAMGAVGVALRMGRLAAPAGLDVLGGPLDPHAWLAAFLGPVWIALGWTVVEWRASRRSAKPAADFLRLNSGVFVAAALFVVLTQVWLVASLVTGAAPGREPMVRLCIVFVGALFLVQGNFIAKSGPPTGEKAPAPGAWTRHALRTGWLMVLVGAALVACGLLLPFAAVTWSGAAGTALLLVNAVANRRRLRASCQQPAP